MSRRDRLESLLKREISTILQTKIQDDRIGFISIISVSLNSDLKIAKVFYSLFGKLDERQKTHKVLEGISGLVKGELGKVLHLKLNFLSAS